MFRACERNGLYQPSLLVHSLLCGERVADAGHCDRPLCALGLAAAVGFLKLLRNGVVESDPAAYDMV